jgi:hypothetical protein
LVILVIVVPLLAIALVAQTEKPAQTSRDCPIEGMSPSDVVDEIWLLATQGELLTPDGWQRAGGFFTKPTPYPGNKVIQIMSNYWGPASVLNSNNQKAEGLLGLLGPGHYRLGPSLFACPGTALHEDGNEIPPRSRSRIHHDVRI